MAAPSSAELVKETEGVEATANQVQEECNGEEEKELLEWSFSLPEQKSSTDVGAVVRYASLIEKAKGTASGDSERSSSVAGAPIPDVGTPIPARADSDDPSGVSVEEDQPAFQPRPSAEYFAMADASWSEADKLLSADTGSYTLEVRLGQALHRKKMKVKQLVASWAKGPSGGDINLAHFRKHVRSLIEEPDVAAIDEMFNRLDSDQVRPCDRAPALRSSLPALGASAANVTALSSAPNLLPDRVALLRRAGLSTSRN